MKKIRTHLVLVVTAIGFFALHFANAKEHNRPRMITVLALGDSLTDGFGLTRKEAYPALIAEKMRGTDYRFEVINAGESGDTTADGLSRLPVLLQKKKIDILILALGINDGFRGVPIEEMRSNLQTIIDQTRARHPAIEIVIAGMQFPIPTGNDYVRAFEATFSVLAERNHAALVPYLLEGVAGNPELNLPDMIHPNAAGQRILADNVWRVLEPVLVKITAASRSGKH